jgi:hypothetical protein
MDCQLTSDKSVATMPLDKGGFQKGDANGAFSQKTRQD